MSLSNPKSKSFAPRGVNGRQQQQLQQRQLQQQQVEGSYTVRLSAKGLAGIIVDRHSCSDIETENAQAPPPPNEFRATIAVSKGSDLLATIPCSGRLRPAPTETVVLRTDGEDIDTQSVASDGDCGSSGPNRYVALWYEQQPATVSFETTLAQANDGTTIPNKYGLLVALKHKSDSMDTQPLGVALLFISTEEMREGKVVLDLPVHAINPQQGVTLPGFGVFLGTSDEKKEDLPGMNSVYAMDPTGDAVLRLELEVLPKMNDCPAGTGTKISLTDPVCMPNSVSPQKEEKLLSKSPLQGGVSGIEIEEKGSDFDWHSVDVLSDTPSGNNPMEPSIELPITNIYSAEKTAARPKTAAEKSTLREAIIQKAQKRSMLKSSMPPRPPSESRSLKMTPKRPSVRLAKNIVVTPKCSVSPQVRAEVDEKKVQRPLETSSPVPVDKKSAPCPNDVFNRVADITVAVEVEVTDDFMATNTSQNETKSPPSNGTNSKIGTDPVAPHGLKKEKNFPRVLHRPRPRKGVDETLEPAVVLEQAKAFPNPNLPEQREKTPPRKNKKKRAADPIFSFEFDNEDSSTVLTDDRSLNTKEVKSRNPVSSLLQLMKIMPSCGELRDIVVEAVNNDDDTLFDFSDGGDSITHMSASEFMVKSTDEISATLQPEDALFGFNMCRAPDKDDFSDMGSDLRGNAYGRTKRWAKKPSNGTDGDSISYVDDMTSACSSLESMKQMPQNDTDNNTWDGSTLPTVSDSVQKVTEEAEESIDSETNDMGSSAFITEDESYTVSSVNEGEEIITTTNREVKNVSASMNSIFGEQQDGMQQKVTDATDSSTSFGQLQYFKAVEGPPMIERITLSEDVELFDAKSQLRSNRVITTTKDAPNKSPKSLIEFPPPAATFESVNGNESKKSLSNSLMHMVNCGAESIPAAVHAVPNRHKKKSPRSVPKVLDPPGETRLGDLTLTRYEKRIDLEPYKERLQAVKERAQQRMRKAQGFFGFGPTELERGSSLSMAKNADYFRDNKDSQVDDAAQAAMAKQEFYTSSNRRTRLEPMQKLQTRKQKSSPVEV